MKLHRSTGRPDWDDVDPGQRNTFQKLAASTKAIVTLSNIVTAIGLALVLYGLQQLLVQNYLFGGFLLAIGRFLDVVDGWLAEVTKTKSPLGELLDASVDKVGTILTIIVMFVAHIGPYWALALLLAPHVIISAITFLLLRKNIKLHPSREGKLSMAAAWVSLVAFIIARAADSAELMTYGTFMAVASALLGLYAAYDYSQQKGDPQDPRSK
ncbi:MAG TPA: CDP-alcohol phosphatidyltransferase family protein [Candidatus Saccharimonadales bacterium]|jgi:cardiolipin synthase